MDKQQIIVNGKTHEIHTRLINKEQIGMLAFNGTDWYKELLKINPLIIKPTLMAMTCTYKNAHPDSGRPEGELTGDDVIRVQDGTVFNIVDTSKS